MFWRGVSKVFRALIYVSRQVHGGYRELSPEGPKRTLEAKKGQLVTSDCTMEYSEV